MENKNFDIVDKKIEFDKRPINDILVDSETIDPQKISDEVLEWVLNNVENFIDSESKNFKLDLVLDSEESMQETRKLQDLYRAIPDDDSDATDEVIEKCQKCRQNLNEVTNSVFEYMKKDTERANKLFKRMAFYQEKIIPNPENKKRALELDELLKDLIQQKDETNDKNKKKEFQDKITKAIEEGESLVNFTQFEGKCAIIKFEYEAFNVGVRMQDGSDVKEEEKKVRKEYVIPEGFTIWIQLVSKLKQRPTAMF